MSWLLLVTRRINFKRFLKTDHLFPCYCWQDCATIFCWLSLPLLLLTRLCNNLLLIVSFPVTADKIVQQSFVDCLFPCCCWQDCATIFCWLSLPLLLLTRLYNKLLLIVSSTVTADKIMQQAFVDCLFHCYCWQDYATIFCWSSLPLSRLTRLCNNLWLIVSSPVTVDAIMQQSFVQIIRSNLTWSALSIDISRIH